MAEVTYRSAGFFETEIDLSGPAASGPIGTPAGLIGTSPIGPAFTPTTVSSLNEFTTIFGDDPSNRDAAYYATQEYFKSGQAMTFVRLLGAGGNATTADVSNTLSMGTVKGAGFVISGSSVGSNDQRGKGFVQYIVGKHTLQTGDIDAGFPIFGESENTYTGGSNVNLLRGVLLFATGTRAQILDYTQSYSVANSSDDVATANASGLFKLVISSSVPGYGTGDGSTGIKIYTASLNPDDDNYIAKILNTSPQLFETQQHLLYQHFPVDSTIATLSTANAVAIASGSELKSNASGDSTLPFARAFGKFDARFAPAKTTQFISQPFGDREYNLFYFETIGHGIDTSTRFKISITSLKKSIDPAYPFGTFNILVRDYYDTDDNQRIFEQFFGCNLDPNSSQYVGRMIGDLKTSYNFDTTSQSARRFTKSGKYPTKSRFVRVIIDEQVENGFVPKTSLPFGFRGLPVLKTNDTLTDQSNVADPRRLFFVGGAGATFLTGSVMPPIPYRFKVTTGQTTSTPTFDGDDGTSENVDGRLFWGIKFERVESALDPNASSKRNELIDNIVKFTGIEQLDTLVTGSGADNFANNKFTLAKVAFYNNLNSRTLGTAVEDLSGSLNQIMVNAFYARSATPDPTNYTVDTGAGGTALSDRITFASLCSLTSSYYFNRFTDYTKFTNVMYGGWDGTNILNSDMSKLNDKATSGDAGGLAISSPNIGLAIGSTANTFGINSGNSAVNSYRSAIDIITDTLTSRVNVVTIPGIRDSAITNYALSKVRSYGRALYLLDIPAYDDTNSRIFDTTTQPDVTNTIRNFATRTVDNRYAATYFPDVLLLDSTNSKRVRVPSSVVALGALAQNDKLTYPWYAPAGFNRASLSSVVNLATRINSVDRDALYDARINPITSFPGAGFVIWGQKTLQIAPSALNRVNVVRMIIEVATRVSSVGLGFVFEQNTSATRARFVSQLTPILSLVQSQSGIDSFTITMNESNNTQRDIDQNKLNGRIVIVPTRSVEFIAIDFIVANSGVQFV